MNGRAPAFRRPADRRGRALAGGLLAVLILGASALAAAGARLGPLVPPWAAARPSPSVPGVGPAGSFVVGPTASPTAGPPSPSPVVPEPTAIPPLPPRVTYHLPRTEKVVALTFDDGWNAANGRKILAILEAEHVAATFFVNGMYLDRSPGFWREVVAAGFPVGDHAWHHRDVTADDAATIETELLRTAQRFREITGATMAPYFRPPYGAHDAASDEAAALAGFEDIVLWDAVSGDASRRVTEASMLRGATAGRAGSIVLMHVGPDITPRVLPRIIAAYRARGFRFVTIPELLVPRPLPTPAVSPSGVPRPG